MSIEVITIAINFAELHCPKCGNPEVHPTMKDACLIRAYKVDNYSQCLVCSGYYTKDLELSPENHDKSKGWFK